MSRRKVISGSLMSVFSELVRKSEDSLTVVFDGNNLSDAIDMREFSGLGFKTGAAGWNTANVTVLVGVSENDPNYTVLNDKDGAAYTQTSVGNADSRSIAAELFVWPWAKLKSSVAQTAGVTVVRKG